MVEPLPCCEKTSNDLAAAHKRVATVELQLLLMAASIEGLAKALEEEKEAHVADRTKANAVVGELERHNRDLAEELATMITDRDNWRKAHANAARSEQVAELTQRLADVTRERDQLLRAQADDTIKRIQHGQEKVA